jgi:2-hydroxychromene-2-carboxylate isomerase
MVRPMPMRAELYWSFRSPYSYLAMGRVVAMARDYAMEWDVRIVYPLAIRRPQYFANMDPLHRPYFNRDCIRVAEFLGVPFRRPVPDPIVQDMSTHAIATEQPYIRRLTYLGIEAVRRGRAVPFMDEVSKLIWDGSVEGWDQGDHLARAAARAGLDLAAMEQAIAADPAGFEKAVQSNQQAQLAAGHWGVPLFVLEGEPFFGQDRMDHLLWRMKQKGLQKR